ncbi:hypothetical protein NEFER03_1080 [Nematocida sp. LUAm3]|nr:hypothetical protein NEFER03_1080 [Nematocida sp. LUAm3]KAI5175315.1 hypothetical protein NEFER02_1244 [Nematocida sp. LUAm2]KAI5177728.1 hypothetical protein NEFER01_0952 [Nematocida sp. LUAm1]
MEDEYSPYEILEIGSNATKKELKSAYHKKLLQTHPDVTGKDTAHLFEKVQNAYYRLLNAPDSKETKDGAYCITHGDETIVCSCGEFYYIKKDNMQKYGKIECRGCSNYFWAINE